MSTHRIKNHNKPSSREMSNRSDCVLRVLHKRTHSGRIKVQEQQQEVNNWATACNVNQIKENTVLKDGVENYPPVTVKQGETPEKSLHMKKPKNDSELRADLENKQCLDEEKCKVTAESSDAKKDPRNSELVVELESKRCPEVEKSQTVEGPIHKVNNATENDHENENTESVGCGAVRRTASTKAKATATLEQKIEYMERLSRVSLAYSLHVSKQLNIKAKTHAKSPKRTNSSPPSGASKSWKETEVKGDKPVIKKLSQSPSSPSNSTMESSEDSSETCSSRVKESHGIEGNSVAENLNQNTQEFDNPELFKGSLKDYQIDGLEWLKILYENAVNGILADEMGLGKTVQTIALITHLIEKNVKGPFLIIAPLSTLSNWIAEFNRFAPEVPVVLFHGTAEERRRIMKTFNMQSLPNDKRIFPVVITSFEMPLRRDAIFLKYCWKYLVVDEGHRLKNRCCKLSRFLHSVKSDNRLLLTGTPLQNNLEELWSLLHFLTPEVFGDLQEFELLVSNDDLQSNVIIDEELRKDLISTIHKALSPFILRRMKKDVNLRLPPKKEVLVYAPMSELQWELYSATVDGRIYEHLGLAQVSDDSKTPSKRRHTHSVKYSIDEKSDDDNSCFEDSDSENTFQLELSRQSRFGSSSSNSATYSTNKLYTDRNGCEFYLNLKMRQPFFQLRKICNHPYLVKMPLTPFGDLLIDENIIKSSGKMMVLDVLLSNLKIRGHKVLLFSTMTILLDIIEEYVVSRGYEYSRLDGKVKLEERNQEISKFQTREDIFLFLISTRAGSLGLNLTSADTVIIFDSDWNPQVDLQAQDRCHRIGQTKPVVVYRLVTEGTIDERITTLAQEKRRLEKMVLHNDLYKSLDRFKVESSISIQELKDLMLSKDYSKVVHTKGTILEDKVIEELLDRSDLLN